MPGFQLSKFREAARGLRIDVGNLARQVSLDDRLGVVIGKRGQPLELFLFFLACPNVPNDDRVNSSRFRIRLSNADLYGKLGTVPVSCHEFRTAGPIPPLQR